MSREISTSLVGRNLQSVNKERIPVSQHNVNDLIDAQGVYFNLAAFNRKAFIFIFFYNSYKTNMLSAKISRDFIDSATSSPSTCLQIHIALSNINFDVDNKQDAMRKPLLYNQETRLIE